MSFKKVLDKFRKFAFSERDKGDKFERLMQAYLQTDPKYAPLFKKIWLWNEFPYRKDFGTGQDTGIDLVAQTTFGEFWAIQCKCYQESATIDKPAVDTFLSTSSKRFMDDNLKSVSFSHRLWISTTNHWGKNAEECIAHQTPPVTRINLADLAEAPVDWEKLEQGIHGEASRPQRKILRPHQEEALNKAHEYFKSSGQDRGKLIMACGTGKTFTSLKIAEHETEGKGLILFLVPSISLLGQTLNEWTAEAKQPINAICICSDSKITQKKTKNEDDSGFSLVDLALPACTDKNAVIRQLRSLAQQPQKGMTVVFSTYQSIDVIIQTQQELLASSLPEDKQLGTFDLIICDEAHRTTGVTLAGDDESAFVKVHNNTQLRSQRRLYMTATPRLYSDDTKSRAAQIDAVLCSMDDPAIFGEEIHRIGFGEAVSKGLLADYKVLILTLSQNDVPLSVQQAIADETQEINTDDATKFIGCINALSKKILGNEGFIKETDPSPMHRAVAFCQNIKISQKTTGIFNSSQNAYYESLSPEMRESMVTVFAEHVDGSMPAPERSDKLTWLKEAPNEGFECRVLTNVRCLSEGVDVPSLDAVLFLSARNSQVDVVQSVGRVMRTAPGKKYGYIIIPVVIPANIEPEKALDDNNRFKVVWTVLNALRAHDDRFNATINKIELNKHKPSQIIIGGIDNGEGSEPQEGKSKEAKNSIFNQQLSIQFEEMQGLIYARMVQKVGDRRYWENWAKDVAQIAERHIDRVNCLVAQEGEHKIAFEGFLEGLQKNINPTVTKEEAVEMLSQHIITKPVFEALFQDYSFVKNNPISTSMQQMLDLLEAQSMEKDTETLEKFYNSVRERASGIDNSEGKQRVIIELYDKFFRAAFPKTVEKLGIVYTPVEVVDFIIHSVDAVLRKEFRRTFSDENIHILDPFTGTGTFITRLLQSGLISSETLPYKYAHEIHANEIVLLAYYIAAINIENAYHDLMGTDVYKPFEGICLTDTFQLGESDATEKLFSEMFPQNSERVLAQKKAPLRVIIGNPPYSVGQKSANDNAQNQSYSKLDNRIAETYASKSSAGLGKALYDAYIKAFRWATDRLDKNNGGIIAFVSNGSWLDGNATDGFRKCLEKEFSSIYVFNLRGNCRTQGELRRKEAGNIFGLGSRTPITITLLIKNPANQSSSAEIHYHDIGDYLTREEKLDILKKFGNIGNTAISWQKLLPNEHGDWLNQRNDIFETFFPLAPDKKFDIKSQSVFCTNIIGVSTNRDAWVYNFSTSGLQSNMQRMIDFYNIQREAYTKALENNPNLKSDDFIDTDPLKISWSVNLKKDLEKGIPHNYENNSILTGNYRPFCKQYLYWSTDFIERPGLNKKMFPNPDIENRVIAVSGIGASKDFSVLITNCIPCLDAIEKGQCFPLYYYEEHKKEQLSLFDNNQDEYIRRDGISDFILERAKKIYGNTVKKEDIFHYVYGLLHCPDYRNRFASDLKKMLPRIPLVEMPRDFWAIVVAGRDLADLHLNYETLPIPDNIQVTGLESQYFHVTKMRFPDKNDKTKITYNSKITIENIPEEAYEYVVNGKSAIEWIMERYQITTNKDSGIRNDPNDWAEEVGNPRYILDLLLRIIHLSLETMRIVKRLPKLEIAE